MPQTSNPILQVLTASIIAALVLFLFYRLVQTKWPTSYYSTSDLVGQSISQTLPRFLLYRYLPVYVVSVIACANVPTGSKYQIFTAVIAAIIHFTLSNMIALTQHLRSSLASKSTIIFHIAVTIGGIIVGLIAGLTATVWRSKLPGFDKYMEVLSTGVVAALASTYLVRWTQRGHLDPEQTLEKFRSIPQNVVDATVNLAKQYRVDRDLAMTILYTEYTQRPPWSQRIENGLNKLRIANTVGAFQANRKLVKSLILEVEPALSNLANTAMPRSHGYSPKQSLLLANLEKHNKSENFLRFAETVFSIISQDATPVCRRIGDDGTPAIRKLGSRRSGMQWTVWGDVAPEIEKLVATTHDYEDPQAISTVREVRIKEGRYRPIWVVHFELPHDTLVISTPPEGLSHGVRDESYTVTINPDPYL